jgi:hypothetical protein
MWTELSSERFQLQTVMLVIHLLTSLGMPLTGVCTSLRRLFAEDQGQKAKSRYFASHPAKAGTHT